VVNQGTDGPHCSGRHVSLVSVGGLKIFVFFGIKICAVLSTKVLKKTVKC